MKKTREQIEQIALERWPDDGFHGINQERREAFIEGYTLCQEEDSKSGGAIPYEALSDEASEATENDDMLWSN